MLQARPANSPGRQLSGPMFARLAASLLAVLILLTPEVSIGATTNLWSLAPLPDARAQTPPLPPTRRSSRNPIDAFVQIKLNEKGLTPSAEADKTTLLRRVCFDLTGLPPTPEQSHAFLSDLRPHAYEHLVDQLLASPRHGERFARLWMDIAHFAETHGHDQDRIRTNAWPYRDYLIRSFNQDKAYTQFVQEQVAGDALFPDEPDAAIALGFIAAGPWDESSLRDIREDTIDRQIGRNLDRDDMVSTVMGTFNSVTVHCARCHNHKFDPISQQDYYSLQAVFAGVDRSNRAYDPDPAKHRKRQDLMAQLRTLRRSSTPDDATLKVRVASLEESLKQLGPPQFVYAAANDFIPDGSLKPSVVPREIRVLKRGDILKPAEVMGPGALSAISTLQPRFTLSDPLNEASRRAALAAWLTSPDNPLTWRSIVNRVWAHHFGRGIVETPNDFGRMGATPSHPELLDWLAVWFRDHGQSLKALHRLIVTSHTYRQTSVASNASALSAKGVDEDNRLLWRMNQTRLDAECIRDAILQITGRLEHRMGGPSDQQFDLKPGIHVTPKVNYTNADFDAPSHRRRSIYRFLFRTLPDPFMDALDCPAGDQATPVRNNSVTLQQALAMWNDAFVLHQSRQLASLISTFGGSPESTAAALIQLALTRPGSPDEVRALAAHAEQHGWPHACRVVINLNEFMFVN